MLKQMARLDHVPSNKGHELTRPTEPVSFWLSKRFCLKAMSRRAIEEDTQCPTLAFEIMACVIMGPSTCTLMCMRRGINYWHCNKPVPGGSLALGQRQQQQQLRITPWGWWEPNSTKCRGTRQSDTVTVSEHRVGMWKREGGGAVHGLGREANLKR